MTDSVSKQRVFAPTISVGAVVTTQRIFTTIHIPSGAVVSAQRTFVPIYSLGNTRRRQAMVGGQ